MHNKIMEAAEICSETAQEIWKEKIEENEEWLDDILDLRERKQRQGRSSGDTQYNQRRRHTR